MNKLNEAIDRIYAVIICTLALTVICAACGLKPVSSVNRSPAVVGGVQVMTVK